MREEEEKTQETKVGTSFNARHSRRSAHLKRRGHFVSSTNFSIRRKRIKLFEADGVL